MSTSDIKNAKKLYAKMKKAQQAAGNASEDKQENSEPQATTDTSKSETNEQVKADEPSSINEDKKDLANIDNLNEVPDNSGNSAKGTEISASEDQAPSYSNTESVPTEANNDTRPPVSEHGIENASDVGSSENQDPTATSLATEPLKNVREQVNLSDGENSVNDRKDTEIKELRNENTELKAKINELNHKIVELQDELTRQKSQNAPVVSLETQKEPNVAPVLENNGHVRSSSFVDADFYSSETAPVDNSKPIPEWKHYSLDIRGWCITRGFGPIVNV